MHYHYVFVWCILLSFHALNIITPPLSPALKSYSISISSRTQHSGLFDECIPKSWWGVYNNSQAPHALRRIDGSGSGYQWQEDLRCKRWRLSWNCRAQRFDIIFLLWQVQVRVVTSIHLSLNTGGRAKAMSIDHKPSREDEVTRIHNLGGKVVQWGQWRVQVSAPKSMKGVTYCGVVRNRFFPPSMKKKRFV